MRNPTVLVMELQQRMREKKVGIVAFLFLLSLTVMEFSRMMMFESSLRYSTFSTPPADIGFQLFTTNSIFVLVLMLILSPLAGASRISQEREQRTLPALLNTPLTPFDIVLGKWGGTVVFILWLLGLCAPFLVIPFLWVGIPLAQILIHLSWIVLASVTVATMALGFSGIFNRTLNSYLATGAFLFFWLGAWPLLGSILRENFRLITRVVKDYLFFYHHPLAIINHNFFSERHLHFLYAYLVWVVLSVIFFWIAVRSLRRGINS